MQQYQCHGCGCVIVFVCVYHGSCKRCGTQDNAVSCTIVAVCVLITAGPSKAVCVLICVKFLNGGLSTLPLDAASGTCIPRYSRSGYVALLAHAG
jgi:hypothetical protein